MLTTERLLRLIIEVIFIFLGALVIWLGLTCRIMVDRHWSMWLVLSGVLIFRGVRVLYKPGQRGLRWESWTRGLSLALLGVLMLVISRAPFEWVCPLLAVSGGLLAVRGIIGSLLVFRPR